MWADLYISTVFPRSLLTTVSDRQNNLDAHVFPLMHNLAIDDDLISTDPVALGIRGVRRRGDLDLAPLTIGGHDFAFCCAILELLVDALFIDTSLTLDQG